VPITRPRDPVRARTHPAFAPLYEKLWNDLTLEVDRDQQPHVPEKWEPVFRSGHAQT
jgi:hypothetical protein